MRVTGRFHTAKRRALRLLPKSVGVGMGSLLQWTDSSLRGEKSKMSKLMGSSWLAGVHVARHQTHPSYECPTVIDGRGDRCVVSGSRSACCCAKSLLGEAPCGSAVYGSWTKMSPAPPPDSMTGGGQGRIDEQGRIDNITDAARDFALQLP